MDPSLCCEFLSFLSPDTRADVKSQALEYLLGVSATPQGRRSLCDLPGLLQPLLDLTSDPSPPVVQDSYHILVNMTSDPCTHPALLDIPTLLTTLISRLYDPQYIYADSVCTALCNLSREEETCRSVLSALKPLGLNQLLEMICSPKYNLTAKLDYLGPLLCNLTQLSEGRDFILDRTRCVIQRLLPYTHNQGSVKLRGGIVGTLRNCCFNHRDHAWLLGNDVDLLPFLLLPLAGGEEYTDEEMEILPPDLQYLSEDKQRELDPDIRKMLIECLQLLCAIPDGRRNLKDRGTYLILRSLHSWETQADVKRACEKVIQVLIGDEPAPGMENLLEVTVPPEVEEKLKQLDEEEDKALDDGS
ncbi:LOW QUALITY PROTEIN: protein HGH1 homolog [Mixophyes fleayi]|uniref:LOW QUALITY PROTEIN: protein HGH1 homolog n=1 Tax=Mixophyes fleayi TaxID=3061075 RepID=UPI003F4DE3BC